MDFRRDHTRHVGGNTHKERNIRDLANHAKPTEGKGSPYANSTHSGYHAKPPDGKTPPHVNHSKPAYHAKPFQSFTTEIPYGFKIKVIIRVETNVSTL